MSTLTLARASDLGLYQVIITVVVYRYYYGIQVDSHATIFYFFIGHSPMVYEDSIYLIHYGGVLLSTI